jgi:hypothetical protein
MKKLGIVSLMSLVLLAGSACEAKARDWKTARVINSTESAVSWVVTGQKNTMHYTVETDDMVYFIDYTYEPGERKNGKPPDIGGNAVTKIAVEGKHAYVLDATGQEIKLKVVKKTKK